MTNTIADGYVKEHKNTKDKIDKHECDRGTTCYDEIWTCMVEYDLELKEDNIKAKAQGALEQAEDIIKYINHELKIYVRDIEARVRLEDLKEHLKSEIKKLKSVTK